MRNTDGWRVFEVGPTYVIAMDDTERPRHWGSVGGWHTLTAPCAPHDPIDEWPPPPAWLPDLSDAATIGCVCALVREAHGARLLVSDGPGASVALDYPDGSEAYYYADKTDTIAEALVCALEAGARA